MGFSVRPVVATIEGKTFRGSAYVPEPEGNAWPTAILYHGFSGHRIEASRAFVQLARALVSERISVVAIDRAGHGESDGDFYDTTVSGDIADSLQLLERIVSLDFVDSDDLHLLGLSMGGVVATVVAAETTLGIRSLTLWSVAAVFADEVRAVMLQGESTERVSSKGYFDFHGQRLGPGFFDDAERFDVYGRARGYHGPVRVLHGDLDFIPHSYAEAYADVYGDAMEYTLVSGADHLWETVPMRDYVIAESVAFITSHTSTR
jgi:pimeloyl-ACP methyl ester carboxylesterase